MNSFPQTEAPVEDPILVAARELRNNRIPIPLDYAFHLVDIAAEQEGRDYVYKKRFGFCWNFKHDENGYVVGDCLIGRVFEFFVDYSDDLGRCSQHATAWQANRHYDNVFTPDAEDFLGEVQTYQDAGDAWGDSIDRAKAKFLGGLEDKNDE